MKRSGPIKRKTPLAKQSPKVKARQGERKDAKAGAMLRDKNSCVAQPLVPQVRCGGPLDGHERLPRGRGGSPYEIDNILTVCRLHHSWIHGHPIEAKNLELLE